MIKMRIAVTPATAATTTTSSSSSECHLMMLQQFTPSPSPRRDSSKKASSQAQHGRLKPTTTTTPLTPKSCRQCLHMLSQVNALRCKLRAAHAAYTATQCRDEFAFAHIPMLTVRSYKPAALAATSSRGRARRPWPLSSMKLEIRRHEAVNALFMADDKWIYVKTSDERRGFIPAKCCQPFARALDPVLAHSEHYSKFTNSNQASNVNKKAATQNLLASDVVRIAACDNCEHESENLNDLSLFSVSYLDISSRRETCTSIKPTVEQCVYDNLNEFKSCSSSSSSSSSSSNADAYAYLSEDQRRMTTPNLQSSNKRKRNNPYDTLRRCQRNINHTPLKDCASPPTIFSKRIRSESEKKPNHSKDNMLLMRIYKKLKVVKASNHENNNHDGDGYENLDEFMIAPHKRVSSSCSSLSSEHIYCNTDFF